MIPILLRKRSILRQTAGSLYLFLMLADIGLGQTQGANSKDSSGNQTLETVEVVDQRETDSSPRREAQVGVFGERNLLETPFSAESYSQELLEKQQARSVKDALINEPSLQNQTTASSYNSILKLRGFDVSNYYFDGLSGLMSTQVDFPVEIAASFDVLKGPSSVAFGGGSVYGGIGGSVNIVPKRPPIKDAIRSVTVGYQSRKVGRISTDFGGRTGDKDEFGYRFNLGSEDGERAARDNKVTNRFAAASVDWRARSNLILGIDLGFVDLQNRGYQDAVILAAGLDLPKAPDPTKNWAYRWNEYTTKVQYGLLKADWQLTEAWSLELATLSSTLQQEYNGGGAINITAANGDGFLDKPSWSEADPLRSLSTRVGLRGVLQTGFLSHELITSFRQDQLSDGEYKWGYMDIGAGRDNLSTNIYTPVSYPSFERLEPVGNGSDRARTDTFQLSDFISLSSQWTLLAGLGHVTIEQPNIASKKSKVSPLGGLMFRPTPESLVYGGYSEALQGGGTAPDDAVNARQRMGPKTSTQTEVGARYFFGTMMLQAAFFKIDQGLEYVNGENRFVQDGIQRHQGAEFSASGKLRPDLELIANYTFIDPKVKEGRGELNDRRPSGVSKRNSRLFAEHGIKALKGLALNGSVNHRSSAYMSLENTGSIPSYTIYDFGLRYDFKPEFDAPAVLRLTVENVEDKKYWSSASWDCCLAVGESRLLKLSASSNF